ncbi:hypothetical protein QCA50_017279 [Cerrena zonata]|uniref:Uncharacterized protein n=1 Tax=Cerrena zonata TaxID=2478898 RepID=A0AAW0FMU8_9APHY
MGRVRRSQREPWTLNEEVTSIFLDGVSQKICRDPYAIPRICVTRSGTKSPSGLAFPGAYSPTDPGIHFNPYQGDAADQVYVAPGGPVYPGL